MRRQGWWGFGFVSVWLVGFIIFLAGPLVAALWWSFTNWGGVGFPKFTGVDNYRYMFTEDPLFRDAVRSTFLYSIGFIPASTVLAFAVALVMNSRFRGMAIIRTAYYLPSVISGVAAAVLWSFVFNTDYGVFNGVLSFVGVPRVNWLGSQTMVVPAFIIMSLWTVGGPMIIYLAGLQNVPKELYEAAEIDGANAWERLKSITIPLTSGVILFNVVLATITSLQIFTQAFIMTGGGPGHASFFYALYIYRAAFRNLQFGYASALGVVLFLIIAIITFVIFAVSKRWVFYASSRA